MSSEQPQQDSSLPEARGLGYWLGFVVGFTARWTLRLLLTFLLLVLLAYFLIQVPAVQRWAAKNVSQALSKSLEVRVDVDRIDIIPFTSVQLTGVFIGDRQGDTLLLTQSLRAQFFQPIRSLLDRTLYIEAIDLRGARLNLYKDSTAIEGNFSFLEPFFAPKPSTTYSERDPIQINLTQLGLQDIELDLRDDFQKLAAVAKLDTLEAFVKLLDLPKKTINSTSIELHGLDIQVDQFLRNDELIHRSSPSIQDSSSLAQLSGTFLVPFNLTIEDVEFTRGKIRYHDRRTAEKGPRLFDPKNLQVDNLAFGISDLSLSPDSLGFVLEQVELEEIRSGLKLYDLSAGIVSLTAQEFLLEELNIQTASSRIGDRLRVALPANTSWIQALNEGRIELDLKPSSIQLGDLVMLAPKLRVIPFFIGRDFDKIQLQGIFRGSLANLRVKDLQLKLPDGTFLSGDISTRNLLVPEEAMLNLEITSLKTSVAKVRKLVPLAKIPQDFDLLGEMSFSGRFDGFYTDFVAYGDLTTELGRATLDTRFIAEKGKLPRYTGNAKLFDFDLGAYTKIADLGKVTAQLDIKQGVGLRPADLRLDVIGSVDAIAYKGYTYRGIKLNGRIDPDGYEGTVEFADEHADFDFNGKISLAESDQRFDFTAAIRKLDLQPLNLSKEAWSLSGLVDLTSNTLDPDNLRGTLEVRDVKLTNPKGKEYTVNKLNAKQVIAPDGSKRLSLDSPIALLDLSGQYRLRSLPNQLLSAFAKTYPDLFERAKLKAPKQIDSLDTRISLEAKVLQVDSLFEAFNIPIKQVAGSQLAITFDSKRENFDFSFSSLTPEIAGLTLKNLGVELRGQSGELDLSANAETLDLGAYGFKNLQVYSEYADGDIRFSVNADTATSVLGNINFGGSIMLQDTAVSFSLDPSSHIDIGGERWTVEAGNQLIFGNKRLLARDVQLTAGERFIEVESLGDRGLNILLRKFNVDLLNAYLNPDKLQVKGEIDAFFTAEDLYSRQGMSFSASIDTFSVNGVDWGALQTLLSLDSLNAPLTTYTTFSRQGQQAVLDGQFALNEGVTIGGINRPKNYFDTRLTSTNFDMSFLSYFIPGILDLKGKLGADLHIYGTPEAPIPEGGILVDQCALTIQYLQTRYFVDNQYVTIDQRKLDATGRQIRDRQGNIATITGGLVHENLKKWALDVSIKTDRLSVLNTAKSDNPLYYGTAFANGRVAFSGPFNQTDIDIDASALGGSKVVFPVTGTSTDDEIRFIKFRQPDDSTTQEVASFLRGINLDMDIKILPAAELLIIFDEAAGDILRGQGTGDIQIDVKRTGTYSMFGEYNVEQGDYLFTLLNLVNKPFAIRPGGTINWDGDPFTAQLNLTAEYQGLSVAPIGLIAEYEDALQARGNGLVDLARQRSRVSLLMNLNGDLLRPDLSFEIEMPDLQGELRNYVNSKLALIRSDENALNRQVFGLIVIGQFLPEVNALQASTVGFNTISELFSNQLSYLLTELITTLAGTDGALSGIDIDINLQNNSSLVGAGNDLQTQLRTYFFDDRLEIGVGVNFGETVLSPGQGQFTAGKIEVAYSLTEDRRLRLRTFGSTNVDLQNFSRRAGVGVSFRRQFDGFDELFNQTKKAKRKEELPKFFKDVGEKN